MYRYLVLVPSYCNTLGPICEWACSRLLAAGPKCVSAAVSSSAQSREGVLYPMSQFIGNAYSALAHSEI